MLYTHFSIAFEKLTEIWGYSQSFFQKGWIWKWHTLSKIIPCDCLDYLWGKSLCLVSTVKLLACYKFTSYCVPQYHLLIPLMHRHQRRCGGIKRILIYFVDEEKDWLCSTGRIYQLMYWSFNVKNLLLVLCLQLYEMDFVLKKPKT